jgi:peptidoglycan hydrolase-like protein with peptidoglycan-binding domain
MKRFWIAVLVGGLFLGFASTASAVSLSDLQAQINDAWRQVESLRTQVGEWQRPTAPPVQPTPSGTESHAGTVSGQSILDPASIPRPRICEFLTRDLGVGSSGADVTVLQEYLKSEGVLTTTSATGYFGPLTRDALAKWQERKSIVRAGNATSTGAGRLGPLSREHFRKLCENAPGPTGGGANNTERFSAEPLRGGAPLSVTFKTWISGFRIPNVTYTIDFGDGKSEAATNCNAPADACIEPGLNVHTYDSDRTYTATLNKITDPCHGQVACRAAIMREVVGTLQIRVGSDATQACTKEHKPVCGLKQIVCITTPCNPIQWTYGNKCELEVDGAKFLYSGQCRGSQIEEGSDASNPANHPLCKSWRDSCGNICSRGVEGGPAVCTLMACREDAAQKAMCTVYFRPVTEPSSNTSSAPEN